MPRMKTRQDAIKRVDIALDLRLKKEQLKWKNEMGENISFIDMSMYFAMFSDFDYNKIKKVKMKDLL